MGFKLIRAITSSRSPKPLRKRRGYGPGNLYQVKNSKELDDDSPSKSDRRDLKAKAIPVKDGAARYPTYRKKGMWTKEGEQPSLGIAKKMGYKEQYAEMI